MTAILNTPEIARTLRAALVGTAFAVAAVATGSTFAFAQSAPIIYPSQGQSIEHQAQDEATCRSWAQQQTGFNPAYGPAYVGSSPGGGEVARGAAGGALLGVVGGAIGGNAGKGAAIGAGVGATSGLLRKNSRQRSNEQAQRQANNQYNQQLAGYNRAFGACMQGRGYVVN
jgi:YMGG-like Gly-zipper